MHNHSYPLNTSCDSKPTGSIRMWLLVSLGLVVLLALLAVILLVRTVDDWGRDLNENSARTTVDHPDPALRCLSLPGTIEQAVTNIRAKASELKGWKEVSAQISDQAAQLRFERTTPWFRFVDDITITVTPIETGTRISVSSQSRIGKGDLGQNPRNIRELLSVLVMQSSHR